MTRSSRRWPSSQEGKQAGARFRCGIPKVSDGLEVCCVFYRPGPGGAICVVWSCRASALRRVPAARRLRRQALAPSLGFGPRGRTWTSGCSPPFVSPGTRRHYGSMFEMTCRTSTQQPVTHWRPASWRCNPDPNPNQDDKILRRASTVSYTHLTLPTTPYV